MKLPLSGSYSRTTATGFSKPSSPFTSPERSPGEPRSGSLLEAKQVIERPEGESTASDEAWTVTETRRILWFGGQRVSGSTAQEITGAGGNGGGAPSPTVTSTLQELVAPSSSVTVRVTVVVPSGNRPRMKRVLGNPPNWAPESGGSDQR